MSGELINYLMFRNCATTHSGPICSTWTTWSVKLRLKIIVIKCLANSKCGFRLQFSEWKKSLQSKFGTVKGRRDLDLACRSIQRNPTTVYGECDLLIVVCSNVVSISNRLRDTAATLCTNKALSPVHTSNNVEATFDFVEAIFDIVAFDNVASTLLLVWTGHYRSSR